MNNVTIDEQELDRRTLQYSQHTGYWVGFMKGAAPTFYEILERMYEDKREVEEKKNEVAALIISRAIEAIEWVVAKEEKKAAGSHPIPDAISYARAHYGQSLN